MYPQVLYLQREFCGLQPGAEFELRSSHPSDTKADHRYLHTDAEGGVFVVPADAAVGDPEWFDEDLPSADDEQEMVDV
jgi:hypothetical protein